ncbi:hypothetical protein QJS04_geneDACA001675 [Acorus gramineus]|uniref:Uncharacterized protein n=1 Tax=Acorus gramineus TaxID=55184 RepID=A0AAV9BL92_ACOGR|nr:hypothetical protein QJS04_geneDACA001675 [Acorus gramineus]
MDIWSWITNLPISDECDSPFVFELASSKDDKHNHKAILLKAERTAGSNPEALVTFSVCLEGFHNQNQTLWVSSPCSHPFKPLLLQLIGETLTRAPSPDLGPLKLDVDSLESTRGFSGFFDLVLLSHLFWLCACDAPSEVGSLFFQALSANLEATTAHCGAAMRDFLVSAGADVEAGFMRAVGYMLAKWCMLRDLQNCPRPDQLGFAYAAETHGLLALRGYAPVTAMPRVDQRPARAANLETYLKASESLLRYALAHQQLEAVIQLEYSITAHERFIKVSVRVDNLRFHVVRLGYGKGGGGAETEERHFPSRVRVRVGPEPGSGYATGLSLGRSTANPVHEVETRHSLKGVLGNAKTNPGRMKAASRSVSRARRACWSWEQEAEGNTAVFEGVMQDRISGEEVATWREGGGRVDMRGRCSGPGRALSKSGGLVVAGDELGEWVSWRVGREMEGKVVRWRVGGNVWVSYFPNHVRSSYSETRCVDWCETVDLPLVCAER